LSGGPRDGILSGMPAPGSSDRRPVALSLVLALATLAGPVGAATGCRAGPAAITAPFGDDFGRAELGPDWLDTGGGYRIADGRLNVAGAYNHPLWLRRKLPRDAVVEVDAMSKSPAGDIKLELYGDGESFDPDRGSYVSTGYVLIFGGWGNSLSVICRNNEHDEGRKAERRDRRVEMGKTYHFTITRKGGLIDWRIDGAPFLSWTDAAPLEGSGHQHLAFNNWEADVWFDNLAIRPAP
jgi:hypothetical protein